MQTMDKSKARCGLLWIGACFIIILSFGLLTYGAKVLVGCTDEGPCGVYSAETNGDLNMDFQRIMTVNDIPWGITHDIETGYIYVTVNGVGILRANQNGTGMQTVIDLSGQSPRGSYVTNDQIFWSDSDADTISRAGIDGNDSMEIVSNADGCWGITGLDSSIYWAEMFNDSIQMAALNGSGVRNVVAGLSYPRGVTIDKDEMKLYAASNAFTGGRVVQYDLCNDAMHDIYDMGIYIDDLAVLDEKLLIVEYGIGLKALLKDSGSQLNITYTGLETCSNLHSVHAINDYDSTTTPDPSTSSTGPSYSTIVPDISSISDFENFASKFPTNATPGIKAKTNNLDYDSTTTPDPSTSSTGPSYSTIVPDISSISDFENFASKFPTNATPGIKAKTNNLVFYLFGLDAQKEDFTFDNETDTTVSIPKGFMIESGLGNQTGYLSVVIYTTPNDDISYYVDDSDIEFLLGSTAVSVNLFDKNGNLVKNEDEQNPMNITFLIEFSNSASIQIEERKHVCAFWGDENNLWSTNGSVTYKADINETLQTCGFTHLTTFAVLFEFSQGVGNAYSYVIEKVVHVGIIVSLLALLAGLVICGLLWKRTTLDKEKMLIHANLMTAMLISYTLTIASQGATKFQNACLAVTILRYNMFLTVFCCMLVEAFHLYRMIVLVFGIERNFRVAYIVISWGVPLLMTTITAAVGRGNLYNQERCWLTGHFIWAFIAPVIAILLLNLVILAVVVYKTLKAAGLDQDKVKSIRIGLRSTALLLPMVGVAWLIGLLGNLNINVMYFFDILSSLQGVYLVFVTCYVNSEVRDALKREWIRRNGRIDNINMRRRISVQPASANNTQDTTDG